MHTDDLKRLNPNINASKLSVGQYIVVSGSSVKTQAAAQKPKAVYQTAKYTVQSGDTLWGIAIKFGVTVDRIKNVNKLKNADIKPGKVLATK